MMIRQLVLVLSLVLDPTWANPAQCRPGETPQECKYRLWPPGFVLISEGDWSVNAVIARVAWEYDVPLWNFLITYAPPYFNNPDNMQSAWRGVG
jgi:hypothetical protein